MCIQAKCIFGEIDTKGAMRFLCLAREERGKQPGLNTWALVFRSTSGIGSGRPAPVETVTLHLIGA